MRDVEQALTKANVEGFFGKVVDGKHPVRGGNGWLEMTKRAFLSIIYFFYVSLSMTQNLQNNFGKGCSGK